MTIPTIAEAAGLIASKQLSPVELTRPASPDARHRGNVARIRAAD